MKRPTKQQSLDVDVVEDICQDVAARSAVLEVLAVAWSYYDPGGTNTPRDQHFWRGVEDLMRANRHDLDRLYAHARGEDDKGGE